MAFGKPREALGPLREAVARSNNHPLISAMFGHALVATEDSANYPEALRILRLAVQRDNQNPDAWYQLGTIYAQQGDHARAALATAERYSLSGLPQLALAPAQTAAAGLPQGSADWLRAQDIAMVSRQALAERKRRK